MAKEKKQSMMKDALILCAISLIAALALGFTNELTKDRIAFLAAQAKAEAYQAVYPEAVAIIEASDNEILAATMEEAAEILSAGGHVATINEACIVQDANAKVIGYVASVTVKGYDTMTLTVGYTTEGVCTGIEYLELNETVGIGTKVDTPEFKGQFVGKKAAQFTAVKSAAAEDEINAISGATFSTNGVVNGVNAGIYFLSELNNRMGGAN
ncbi:MAG: FMN-binding protein [Lachnospiraceae bacterium]|nr:FMN-binding protein [Lachnospiraceae bacterium]